MSAPLKIVITGCQAHDAHYLRPALESAGHIVRCADTLSASAELEVRGVCDAIVSFVSDRLDAQALAILAAQGVHFIVQRAVGVDNIDLDAARRLGLSVAHVPAYSPESVAEHATALLLAMARHLPQALIQVQQRNFSLDGLLGFSLHGKTVGIVGMGRIGQSFARIMRGFGCRVLAHSRSEFRVEGVQAVSLDDLWQEADVVSLHCPLRPVTWWIRRACGQPNPVWCWSIRRVAG